MPKSELIKRSGWAFIAGSFAFATILTNSDPLAIPGSMISALLLAAGLLSLRAGYGETISRSGRNILLIGAVGAVLWDMVLVSLIAMSSSGILHATRAQGQRFWIVVFGGPAVALLALTLFGLTALRTKPMSRLNWLSILEGSGTRPFTPSSLFTSPRVTAYYPINIGLSSNLRLRYSVSPCSCSGLFWSPMRLRKWRQPD